MLIAIAGSQGTGKSTLLSELNKYYPTVTRKTSRSILTDWNVTLSQVNNDRDLTIRFQDEILARKIADEKEAVESLGLHFTERTFADLFTYALVALGKDNEYSDWLDEYYTKCSAAQDQYVGVFYLKAGHFKPVEDGVRGTNQYYSRLVDNVMYEYTHEFTSTSKYFQNLTSSDLDQRVESVLQYAQQL